MSSPPAAIPAVNTPAAGPVLVVAGPTASGKSALALCLAEALGGVVINADAMQLYADLHILSDRPSAAAEARAPHRLYGVLDAAERGSAAWWRGAALAEIAAAGDAGRPAILCGGTGLYLRALLEGLAEIPAVPAAVVAEAAARHAALGGEAFRAELRGYDPVAAERLSAGDSQRLQRAWAVARATGRPLSAWQADAAPPPPALAFRRILLFPPRPVSAEAIERRFRAMVATGALDEVRRLAARRLDPSLPAMKALGVPQLLAHLEGRMPLNEAVAASVAATRQYAKRQRTWFRHQFASDLRIDAQFSESRFAEIFPKVRELVLTPGK